MKCKRCKRELRNKTSQKRGFGDICYKKYLDSIRPDIRKWMEKKNE